MTRKVNKKPTVKAKPTAKKVVKKANKVLLPTYEKVGRLKQPVAKAINRKAADIFINQNYLKHILIRHKDELEALGFTPKAFVDLAVENFNMIYEGTEESLLLVMQNGKPKVVAIEMNFALKNGFYEVKTATVMSKKYFINKKLLWKKK